MDGQVYSPCQMSLADLPTYESRITNGFGCSLGAIHGKAKDEPEVQVLLLSWHRAMPF